MATEQQEITGGCLCGAVRYRLAVPPGPVTVCHCSQCRRWHGHVGAYAGAKKEQVAITGEDALAWFTSSPGIGRGFCRLCGSSLFWRRDGGSDLDIAAGTLDAPTGLAIVRHIFTASKGDYYRIEDGLPQHADGSDGPALPAG